LQDDPPEAMTFFTGFDKDDVVGLGLRALREADVKQMVDRIGRYPLKP
jgi:hypothetical protein